MALLNKYLRMMEGKRPSEEAIAFFAAIDLLNRACPEVTSSILQELKDQRSYLKLIASENFSSLPIQFAMANLLTDKYSEGYPYHRFYAGCDNVDAIEHFAVEEAKALFESDHAYVQPHSGADANLIAFWAIISHRIQDREIEKLGKKKLDELSSSEYEKLRMLMLSQKMMAMSLDTGGHLTHGYRHNISGKLMQIFSYGVDPKTGMIDYAAIKKQAQEVKPLILLAGYSAYPRLIDFSKMKEIAHSVNAVLMVDMAHFAGLVAGKAFVDEYNPVPYADVITSTTHKTLRGPRGGLILCKEEYRETVDRGCPLVLGGPMPHVIAAKAVAFSEARRESFIYYASQIIQNAKALAEGLLQEGISVLTGGTDNHLVLLDVFKIFTLTGLQAEKALREAFITVNRNMIPNDQNGAWFTSGLRLGTPALTTLGMKEKEMRQIASLIARVLKSVKADPSSRKNISLDKKVIGEAQKIVTELLHSFPLYPEIPEEIIS